MLICVSPHRGRRGRRRRSGRSRGYPIRLAAHLLPLLLPRHDDRLGTVFAQLELGTAGQTSRTLGRLAEDAETDAADEPDVDDAPVAETCGAEVDVRACREDQVPPGALVGQKREHEVLQESLRVRDGHEDPAGCVAGLLEKDGVAGELADVDGDAETLAGEDAVHDRDVLVCGVGGAADGDDEDARLQAR